MRLKDLTRWNTRVSLVYAIGIWTMLGTYAFFQMKRKQEKGMIGSNSMISAEATLEKENQMTDEPKKKTKKNVVETNVVVKEGFIPFSTRIYNYGTSFFDSSSDNSTEK
ncbi:small integral membrane protein 26-like [Pristis pectinata]|uniref:small integral membrane protein 26-like n=1 Tax=Pristis pectinata TaxID=685728 RepID=UPI00223D56F2|nr:small integral membrane protein 26-like [Pristis pectinata]